MASRRCASPIPAASIAPGIESVRPAIGHRIGHALRNAGGIALVRGTVQVEQAGNAAHRIESSDLFIRAVSTRAFDIA